MTIRARVSYDQATMAYRLALVTEGERFGNGAITAGHAGGVIVTPTEPGAEVPPLLVLPEDLGEAVVDAFRAFIDRSDPTTSAQLLREDFLHERGRVDWLLGHVLDRGVL